MLIRKIDKKAMADARTKLARAFKENFMNEKYIVPPKTTDFAIVYAPTESLFLELANYQDPSTKELLTQELMKKYKVTIMGILIIYLVTYNHFIWDFRAYELKSMHLKYHHEKK